VPFPEEILVNPRSLLPQMKRIMASFFVSASRLADMYGIQSQAAELEKKL